jgi:mannose-6-phosphate isomerase-like protein (cupin superfamily)
MPFEVASDLTAAPLGLPDGQFVMVSWRDPGGVTGPARPIAGLHVHHEDDEAWYVLEGALVVRSGEADVEVPAGGAAIVPRGTPHTYWNPQAGPTRYLLVMTPSIRALIDALHALEDRTPEAVAAVFTAHRSEFLGWP